MKYYRRSILIFSLAFSICLIGTVVAACKIKRATLLRQKALITTARAQNGDLESEAALSKMYYYGTGLPQSYSSAFYWARKAANSGDLQAEYDLGILYQRGQGVSQDYSSAFGWFLKAASGGHQRAELYVGDLYCQGLGTNRDYTAAVSWYRKAAGSGLARAQFFLGYMYQNGEGVGQNLEEARAWYQKAASQGDEMAERALGLKGDGLHWTDTIFIVLIALIWLRVASYYLSSKRPSQWVRQVLASISGLTYIVMRVYGAYAGFRSFTVFNSFHLIESVTAGMAIGAIVYFVAPAAKYTRMLIGLIALGFVAAAFIIICHGPWSWSTGNDRIVTTVTGLLAGVAIPVGSFCKAPMKSAQQPEA